MQDHSRGKLVNFTAADKILILRSAWKEGMGQIQLQFRIFNESNANNAESEEMVKVKLRLTSGNRLSQSKRQKHENQEIGK